MAKKMIKFIHVPKTAGTSIEDTALEHGLKWGRHNELGYPKKYRTWGGVSLWHYPLDFYEPYQLEAYRQNQTLFAVVRHPVKKLVSSYNCDQWNHNKSYLTDTKEQFNRKILREINNQIYGRNIRQIPQWRYVMYNGKQMGEVLKLENLEHDFKIFADKHDLPFNELAHTNKSKSNIWTADDLYPEVLDLIYKIYDMDFQLFDYKKSI